MKAMTSRSDLKHAGLIPAPEGVRFGYWRADGAPVLSAHNCIERCRDSSWMPQEEIGEVIDLIRQWTTDVDDIDDAVGAVHGALEEAIYSRDHDITIDTELEIRPMPPNTFIDKPFHAVVFGVEDVGNCAVIIPQNVERHRIVIVPVLYERWLQYVDPHNIVGIICDRNISHNWVYRRESGRLIYESVVGVDLPPLLDADGTAPMAGRCPACGGNLHIFPGRYPKAFASTL